MQVKHMYQEISKMKHGGTNKNSRASLGMNKISVNEAREQLIEEFEDVSCVSRALKMLGPRQ